MAKKVVRKKMKTNKKQTRKDFFEKEIFSIITGAFGIYFVVSVWFSAGGAFGGIITSFLKGLFGDVTYIIPLIIMASAVYIFAAKNKPTHRSVAIAVSPAVLSAILQWAGRFGEDATSDILKAYSVGTDGYGGGFFGALISEPLIKIGGMTGAGIILFAVALISIVLIFEVSVTKVFKQAAEGIGTGIETTKEEAIARHEERKAAREMSRAEKRRAIDLMKYEDPTPGPDDAADDTELEEYNWASSNLVITDATNPGNTDFTEDALPPAQDDDMPPFDTEDMPKPSGDENDKDGFIVPEIDMPEIKKEYVFPSTELLYEGPKTHTGGSLDELKSNAQKLVEIFESFGIEVKVTNITRGSSVTRYEVVPAPGIKVNKLTALDQDIAMRLPANNVRIEVLPGYVGIEVSNDSVSTVYLRGLLETPEFKNHTSKLAVAVGRDINGATVVMDIAKTPHLLIAGATGSGKSVCINTIITSILYKASPDEVKLVLVDPKVVELKLYEGIPHLLVPIVTDPRKAAGALSWAVAEMENRYQKFAEAGARDLKGYNAKLEASDPEAKKLPQIVIIIDELADMMMVAPGEVQDYICRLAQKARAAGMHLVLATQRPSVDVITGLIKANIPSRIAFAVSSSTDSRTIIDHGGAEKLMGKGDMLMMLTGASKLNRVQGAFLPDTDVENVVNFIKQQSQTDYNNDVLKTIEISMAGGDTSGSEHAAADRDELFEAAAEVAFELGQVSASMLQRRLKVGYARAGRLIDELDKNKVISTYDGSNKPRTLIMSRSDFNILLGNGFDENDDETYTEE